MSNLCRRTYKLHYSFVADTVRIKLIIRLELYSLFGRTFIVQGYYVWGLE